MLTRRTIAVFLILLPIWTVAFKFVLPLIIAARQGGDPLGLIMWDFWWIAHLVLARLLLKPGPFTFCAGIAVGFAEISVITVKLGLFLHSPSWNFWSINWFANKCALLALFVVLVRHLLAAPDGMKLEKCSWRRRR